MTSLRPSRTRIAHLGRADLDDVVETLCAAFHEYPVMRYVLGDFDDDYDVHLQELVGWFTFKRLARGRHVLGALQGARMLGAANVDPPQPAPQSPELRERYRRLEKTLGDAAMARFQAFADAGDPLVPPEPHYYIGMIGVRPECQGQGVARLLMEAVHELSARDPASTGVALTTETPLNLPFYKHFGYRVLGRANAEDLVTWTLFRPDDPD